MLISANILAFSLLGKTDYIELYKFVFGIWIRYLEARPAWVQSQIPCILGIRSSTYIPFFFSNLLFLQ
jgi:hypothetical protein